MNPQAGLAAAVRTWLIAGLPGPKRAALIEEYLRHLPPNEAVSLLLEGQPAGSAPEISSAAGRQVHVLAPGCLCCIGNLTLRVSLARVLRHEAPRHLIIAIADARHQARMLAMLHAAPWDGWLHFPELQENVSKALKMLPAP